MFGMSAGDIIRIVLMGIFILVCIALSIVVLMQESKQQGLSGTISGAADTYWGRNKGRSMEGKLVLFTKILGVAFFVLAAILNINFKKKPGFSVKQWRIQVLFFAEVKIYKGVGFMKNAETYQLKQNFWVLLHR